MSQTPNGTPKQIAVFISGSGSNLQAILDAIACGELNAQVNLVVSNRKDAYGLVRAEHSGIPTLYFPLKRYKDAGKSREDYDRDLARQVDAYHPDLLVLAGWMHIFTRAFIENCSHTVINLHPALPGQFPGTHSIERAFEAYLRAEITYSGCMVHFVVPEVDAGPVVAHEQVQFNADDTLEEFEARMHATEHRLIVHAIRTVLSV
jgi:formyltetrahydrofolate-dependent phosphoribosylglycinamide formyltransferase